MILTLTIGILVAGAVYLFLQREMMRVILGFVLLSHAANLVIIAAGGIFRREEPFGAPDDPTSVADPLPQAFVLTAIVIAFSITIFMLALAVTGGDDDDTADDIDAPEGDPISDGNRYDEEQSTGSGSAGPETSGDERGH